ncbi:MAG: hypothetical protein KDD60_02665, partial [Bdellovibrionales bacterium]|nr:hypothetical protein [Bdellovibrionales bacterium]
MGAAWYVFYPILVLWLAMLVIGCGIALSAISFFFFSHNVKIIAWIARLVWILPVVLFGFGMFGIGWVVYHAKNGVSS